MNLELLESFHQNFPESADGHLERIKKDDFFREGGCATYAITLQFNRVGSLIAIGCNDGRIEIWDFITRRIAKILIAHSHPVCSLSWSRNSRQLMSASLDNTVSIWDIVSGDCEATFSFPSPVLKSQFNPRNSNRVLVCPLRHAPVVISVDTQDYSVIKDQDEDLNVVATFDRRGTHVYCGNSKGKVTIQNAKTLETVAWFRSNPSMSNAAIKSIEFSRRGDFFLLSCADKIIRVYDCDEALAAKDTEVQPIQKLKDLVTGSHWRKCCFSGDGEFICAGSMKQHSIYLWERSSGTLVKILHGQKGEALLDVVWHPLRPIIISLSNSLNKEQVSIWAQPQVQNWSAFAPDFKELDENVEYEERESEFDQEDEDKRVEDHKANEQEDVNVDIETIDPVQALLSSDEECEPQDVLMYLSITPEVENPEDTTGFDDSLLQSAESSAAVRKRTFATKTDSSSPRTMGKTTRNASTEGATPPKKQKITLEINLPGAPVDELHPMMSSTARRPANKSSNAGGAAAQTAFTSSAVGAGIIDAAGGEDASLDDGMKKAPSRSNSRPNKVRK